jgi:FkbH-like protein
MTFSELKKNLKKDFTGFKKLKLALLGDSATQLLAQAIRGAGYAQKMDINVYDANYSQVDRQILDISSDLYKFQPDITVIFESGQKMLHSYNQTVEESRINFADNKLNYIQKLYDVLQNNLKTKIIYLNYPEINDQIFGNFGNKIKSSFIFQLRKLNYLLSEFASENPGFNICDISTIQNQLGRNQFFSCPLYISSDLVLNLDAISNVAESIVKITAAFQGKIIKCIILDLDNTIWGGVIGDDGPDNIKIGSLGIGKAFTEFQYWLKKLQQRGIILCICSKNFESVAKEPFEKHPDMVLRLKDIAVFIANWDNKADNIQRIQKMLNIGFDSMVFLDDNPFERNLVDQAIPDIIVPEMPDDPAEYLEYLYSLNLFETASFSKDDLNRTEQYQKESERLAAQTTFLNENDYLKSLNMLSVVKPFDSFSIPRIAQLSQRSNQYNLRTVRYTEDEIRLISSSDRYKTFSFTLEDRFGDNGLICVVILEEIQSKELFIDSWFMSCRVMNRGMDNFVLNTIVDFAISNGYISLKGEYIPSAKNELVKDHYSNLGFIEQGNYWLLEIVSFKHKECFIALKEK